MVALQRQDNPLTVWSLTWFLLKTSILNHVRLTIGDSNPHKMAVNTPKYLNEYLNELA